MSQTKVAERSLFPYAVALQCIPILALVPLIGFWFGYDFPARVIVCVLIALFPIVSNTLFGLQSVDRGQHELFTLHGASRLTRLTKLQFPAAMPAIFAGFRISAGLSVVGAIVGDVFFRQGEAGLGILLDNFRSRLQGPELFATIIVAALLGIVIVHRLRLARASSPSAAGTTPAATADALPQAASPDPTPVRAPTARPPARGDAVRPHP